jgi:minor extracellular serine protease Vpr
MSKKAVANYQKIKINIYRNWSCEKEYVLRLKKFKVRRSVYLVKRGRKALSILLSLVLVMSLLSMVSAQGTGKQVNGVAHPSLGELALVVDLKSSSEVTVIVHLKEKSVLELKHDATVKGKDLSGQRGKVKAAENRVAAELAAHGKSFQINRSYDHVFSGFSVTMPANQIMQLFTMEDVRAVYPDVQYTTTKMFRVNLVHLLGMELSTVPN